MSTVNEIPESPIESPQFKDAGIAEQISRLRDVIVNLNIEIIQLKDASESMQIHRHVDADQKIVTTKTWARYPHELTPWVLK